MQRLSHGYLKTDGITAKRLADAFYALFDDGNLTSLQKIGRIIKLRYIH